MLDNEEKYCEGFASFLAMIGDEKGSELPSTLVVWAKRFTIGVCSGPVKE